MSNESRAHRYIGTIVDTPNVGELRIHRNCAVDVNAFGIITKITECAVIGTNVTVPTTRLPPFSFLLPTFTDLHIHPAQYLYSGTGLDRPLMQWLEKYAYRAEEQMDAWATSDPERVKTVYRNLGKRLIAEGTGSILAFGTIAVETNLLLAEVFVELGLRSYIGKLSMDISGRPSYVEKSASESLSSLRNFIKRLSDLQSDVELGLRLAHPVVTPRFVPTSSDELLIGLGKLVEEPEMQDVIIQSHMCESWDQVEWVRAVKGLEDEEVFDKYGLLTSRTVQAHVTYLKEGTRHLLRDRGTAIAHCPLSNVYFSDAPFPLREALDTPIKVGLGSDIAGGYSPSIQTQMRQAVITARNRESSKLNAERLTANHGQIPSLESKSLRVEWKESLYLATAGGAAALRNPGCFQEGAPFDAQLVNLLDPESGAGIGQIENFEPHETAVSHAAEYDEWWEEMIEKWWCVGDRDNRIGVWVQGRRIFS